MAAADSPNTGQKLASVPPERCEHSVAPAVPDHTSSLSAESGMGQELVDTYLQHRIEDLRQTLRQRFSCSSNQIVTIEAKEELVTVEDLSDEDLLECYNDTKSLPVTARLKQLFSVAKDIAEYKSILHKDFSYADWQKTQQIQAKFSEFGLRPTKAELALLHDADSTEIEALRRSHLQSGVSNLINFVEGNQSQTPEWLQNLLAGKPGAEKIIQGDTEEREQYRHVLMTYFDSLSKANPARLADQVLESMTNVENANSND